MKNKTIWPDGKRFAFTIFDDTDRSKLDNVKEIYSFLIEHGFKTTKSVWPICGNERTSSFGSTCEEPEYLLWLKELQVAGFEIAYHMSTFKSSLREETISGLNKFAELFGYYPKAMANHVGCLENIYWGSDRLSSFNRFIYNVTTGYRRNRKYQGHIEGTKYFWGDICKKRIKYPRNFVFPEINTLRMCPIMPYHDPIKPYVNYWFASSEGSTVSSFNECLSEKNQDRLEKEGGACIMYTHFAFGFQNSNAVDSRFEYLMKRLRKKNGWFVPVSVLLDYLFDKNGGHTISCRERIQLEIKWLSKKFFIGTT